MIFQNDNITYRNIARGLVYQDSKVLLAKDKRQEHYFPPGGGVDFGESISNALERELIEELGWKVKCGDFVACLEHSWHGKKNNFEMNFYFKMEVVDGDLNTPLSKEDHIEFHWVELKEVESLKIFPEEILPKILKAGQCNNADSCWFTTLG